jgi:hypothetical protein
MLLNEAGDEIDRLNTIIKDKIKYLDAWQARYRELELKNNQQEQDSAKLLQKLAAAQEEASRLTYAFKSKSEQADKT